MDFDIRTLRVFVSTMKSGSFSAAARELKTSQPVVSQRIGKLEKALSVRLFERVGHEIIPTQSAKDFFDYATSVVEKTDEFNDRFRSERSLPKGLIRCAMPESCQWTPYFNKIMAELGNLPELQFDIAILPNEEIVKGILEGQYDFGFVTGERLTPELRFERFTEEKYSAVALRKNLFEPLEKKSPSSLRLISYPGWDLFFMTWLKTHGLWTKFKSELKNPTVRVGTLAGAIHAVKQGAGIGVFPSHCLTRDLETGSVFEYKATSKTASAPIFLSVKIGARLPARTQLVLSYLRGNSSGTKPENVFKSSFKC